MAHRYLSNLSQLAAAGLEPASRGCVRVLLLLPDRGRLLAPRRHILPDLPRHGFRGQRSIRIRHGPSKKGRKPAAGLEPASILVISIYTTPAHFYPVVAASRLPLLSLSFPPCRAGTVVSRLQALPVHPVGRDDSARRVQEPPDLYKPVCPYRPPLRGRMGHAPSLQISIENRL